MLIGTGQRKSIYICGPKEIINAFPSQLLLDFYDMTKFIGFAKPFEIVPDFDAIITSEQLATDEDWKTFEVKHIDEVIIELEKKGWIKLVKQEAPAIKQLNL